MLIIDVNDQLTSLNVVWKQNYNFLNIAVGMLKE